MQYGIDGDIELYDGGEMHDLFYRLIRCFIKLYTSICLLLICTTIGATLYLFELVFDYIDSMEHPTVIWSRKLIKKYFRMMFWSKVYNRYRYNTEAVTRGNSYMFRILRDMFEKKSEFDPYVLEDSSVGFYKQIMFVNVSCEAKLHDRHIKGLSTLHRSYCSLQEEGRKFRVRADLGAGQLEFHFKISLKLMNFGPTITVTGILPYIQVFMEFKVNANNGRDGRLTKFAIDDMRGMKVRMFGLGPLNLVVNLIISGVIKIFKTFIQNLIEDIVQKYIREQISNYQFPVGEAMSLEERFNVMTIFPKLRSNSETDSEIEISELSESDIVISDELSEPEISKVTPELVPDTAKSLKTPELTTETASLKKTFKPEKETAARKVTPEPKHEVVYSEEISEPSHEVVYSEEISEPSHEVVYSEEISEPRHEVVYSEEISEPRYEVVYSEETSEPEHEVVYSEETSEFELEIVDSEETSESELEIEDSEENSESELETTASKLKPEPILETAAPKQKPETILETSAPQKTEGRKTAASEETSESELEAVDVKKPL